MDPENMNYEEFWQAVFDRMGASGGKWAILIDDDEPALLGEGIEDTEALNNLLARFFSDDDGTVSIADEPVVI